MRIAFTHNLRLTDSEEEAEFDTVETVDAIAEGLRAGGHDVEKVEVTGPASHLAARIESISPDLIFNTAEGRRKPDNIRRDPRVIVSVQDRNNPQAYAVFHGKGRVTDANADAHIDKLAKKYMGVDVYPKRTPDMVRVIYKIKPEKVNTMG